jgi:hypothetical protein
VLHNIRTAGYDALQKLPKQETTGFISVPTITNVALSIILSQPHFRLVKFGEKVRGEWCILEKIPILASI